MLLFDEVFTHKKLLEASKRVKRKKGASGVDSMSAVEAYKFFRKKYKRDIIIKKLRRGDYIVHSNRIVKIPKANGKLRTLKIQNVIDRTILDCLAVELQEKYKTLFSKHSYGYTKGVGAHTAIQKWRSYYLDGYTYGAKLDLKAYFDKVPHKKLYLLIEKLVDEPLLNVIHQFIISSNNKGLPQGNPISPFLSNLYLTSFDTWLQTINEVKFIRYADDILLLSREPIDLNIIDGIEKKLKGLGVGLNREKTVIGSVEGMTFLGYQASNRGFIVPSERIEKFKRRINTLYYSDETYERRMEQLNQYIMGWIAYYYMADIGELITLTENLIKVAVKKETNGVDITLRFKAQQELLQRILSISYE